ncbi:MAG: hypothetical protein GX321_08885, partial [Clostridiales bacterium]|nr:hypothetical protein [Clostridiales bacterium]
MKRKVVSLVLATLLVSSSVSASSVATAPAPREGNSVMPIMAVIEDPVRASNDAVMPIMASDYDLGVVNPEDTVRPIMASPDRNNGKTSDNLASSEKLLEAAIKAVKSKVQIPKEYSEFDYYF